MKTGTRTQVPVPMTTVAMKTGTRTQVPVPMTTRGAFSSTAQW